MLLRYGMGASHIPRQDAPFTHLPRISTAAHPPHSPSWCVRRVCCMCPLTLANCPPRVVAWVRGKQRSRDPPAECSHPPHVCCLCAEFGAAFSSPDRHVRTPCSVAE